ncbi:hypothetical protein H0H93_014455, partial [Arthromyces matolae]
NRYYSDDYRLPERVPLDSPPYVIHKSEAIHYYQGISQFAPVLIYRTSKTREPWVEPTGPWICYPRKQLRPVFGHKINEEWKNLGPKVRDLLDKQQVRFTSIDVVRFQTEISLWKHVIGPVVVWIGVSPDTLSGEDAFNSANSLLELLKTHDITDVDVEFRESTYKRLAGPELYKPGAPVKFTDRVSTSLGLPISGLMSSDLQGTMGFYFNEGDDLYGVTARHVLFPAGTYNDDFSHTTGTFPRKDVLLMGNKAFKAYLLDIANEIGFLATRAELDKKSIREYEATLARDDVDDERKANAKQNLTKCQQELYTKTEAIEELGNLYE